jgi:uncharacterized protein (TIGR02391 family)
MALQARTKVPPFDPPQITAIAKILADTSSGLTGSEIEVLLRQCEIADPDPQNTKWKRLYNAFAEFQNKHQVGNHVLVFIKNAMNPALHLRSPEVFYQWRADLNGVLSLSGMTVGEDGLVRKAAKATTLSEAVERANRFKSKLERRGVHADVLKFCATEIASDNYFHAVFESMKSVTSKVRALSGVDGDGAELFDKVFSLGKTVTPVVAINSLQTETLRGEQSGFLNLLKGLFGTVRNPMGHEAKIEWEMPEEDALDIMTAASLVHRKLDKSRRLS